jgi:hypothetical protein
MQQPSRSHCNMGDCSTLKPPSRIASLWFVDANLIFQADNHLFRVYGDVLAASSPVFQDMLLLPQPEASELEDGCTLIHLPDSAVDIISFFKAIFQPKYVSKSCLGQAVHNLTPRSFEKSSFAPPPAQTDCRTVLSNLRLAHKYDVPHIRERALQHLASAYPTRLQAWDSRPKTRTFPPILKFDLEFQLLQAALETEARWLMPALFYSCCSYPMHEILNSVKWIGTGDHLEKYKCLLGYVDQFAATSRVLRFLVQSPTERCVTQTKCTAGRLAWFDMVDTWRTSIPLDIWDESDWKRLGKDVCAACLGQSRSTHRKARQVVWDTLPRTYGLPGWDVLEVSKTLARG